jgi:hypothetical protein
MRKHSAELFHVKKFYNWCKKNGLDLSKIDLNRIVPENISMKSSFKDNPQKIKEVHNYKFNS